MGLEPQSALYRAIELFQGDIVAVFEERFQEELGIRLDVDVMSFMSEMDFIEQRVLVSALESDDHPLIRIFDFLSELCLENEAQWLSIVEDLKTIQYCFAHVENFQYSRSSGTARFDVGLTPAGFKSAPIMDSLVVALRIVEKTEMERISRILIPKLAENLSIHLRNKMVPMNVDFESYMAIVDPEMRVGLFSVLGSPLVVGHVPSQLLTISHDRLGLESVVSHIHTVNHRFVSDPAEAGLHLDMEKRILSESVTACRWEELDMVLESLPKDIRPFVIISRGEDLAHQYADLFLASFKLNPLRDLLKSICFLNFKLTTLDYSCEGYLERRFNLFERRRVEALKHIHIDNVLTKLRELGMEISIHVDYQSFLSIQDPNSRKLALEGLGSEYFALRFFRVLLTLHERSQELFDVIKHNLEHVRIQFGEFAGAALDLGTKTLTDIVSLDNGEWSTHNLFPIFEDVFYVNDFVRLEEIQKKSSEFLTNELCDILATSAFNVVLDYHSFLRVEDPKVRARAIEYIDSGFVVGRLPPEIRRIYEVSDLRHLLKMVSGYRVSLLTRTGAFRASCLPIFAHDGRSDSDFEGAEANLKLEVYSRQGVTDEEQLPEIALADFILLNDAGRVEATDPHYPIRYGHLIACAKRVASVISCSHAVKMRDLIGREGAALELHLNDSLVQTPQLCSFDFLERFTGALSSTSFKDIAAKPGAFLHLSQLFLSLVRNSKVMAKEIRNLDIIRLSLGEGDEISGALTVVDQLPGVLAQTQATGSRQSVSLSDAKQELIQSLESLPLALVSIESTSAAQKLKDFNVNTFIQRVHERAENKKRRRPFEKHVFTIYFGPEVPREGMRPRLEQVIMRGLELMEKEIIFNIQTKYIPHLKQLIRDELEIENPEDYDLDIFVDWDSILSLSSRKKRILCLETVATDAMLGRILTSIAYLKTLDGLNIHYLRNTLPRTFKRYSLTLLTPAVVPAPLSSEPWVHVRVDDHDEALNFDDFVVLDTTKSDSRSLSTLISTSSSIDHSRRQSMNLAMVGVLDESSDMTIPMRAAPLNRSFETFVTGKHRLKMIVEEQLVDDMLSCLAWSYHNEHPSLSGPEIVSLRSLAVLIDWNSFEVPGDSLEKAYQRFFIACGQTDSNVFEAVILALQQIYSVAPTDFKRKRKTHGLSIDDADVQGALDDSQQSKFTKPFEAADTKCLAGVAIRCGALPGICLVDPDTRILEISVPFLDAGIVPNVSDIVTVIRQWQTLSSIPIGLASERLRVLKETISLTTIRNGNVDYVRNVLSQPVFFRSPSILPNTLSSQIPPQVALDSLRLCAMHKIRSSFDSRRLRILSVQPEPGDLVIYRPPPRFEESQRIPLVSIRAVLLGPMQTERAQQFAIEIILRDAVEDHKRLVFSLLTLQNDPENSEAAVTELALMIVAAAGLHCRRAGSPIPELVTGRVVSKPQAGRMRRMFGRD